MLSIELEIVGTSFSGKEFMLRIAGWDNIGSG